MRCRGHSRQRPPGEAWSCHPQQQLGHRGVARRGPVVSCPSGRLPCCTRRTVRFAQGPLAEKYRTQDGHPDREGTVARPKRSLGMSWGHDLTPSRCELRAGEGGAAAPARACTPRPKSARPRPKRTDLPCLFPMLSLVQHQGAGGSAGGGVPAFAGPPQAQVGGRDSGGAGTSPVGERLRCSILLTWLCTLPGELLCAVHRAAPAPGPYRPASSRLLPPCAGWGCCRCASGPRST